MFWKIPTRAGSKNPKASPVWSCIIPLMTRFVEVPIIVSTPPPMLAYERGIKNFEGAKSRARAQSRTIGMNRATNGALLMKHPKKRVMQQSLQSDPNSDVLSPSVARAVRSISLERSTAFTTTNMEPTTTKELLLKPSRASMVVIIPRFQTNARATNITTSGGRASVMSITRTASITVATTHACQGLPFSVFPNELRCTTWPVRTAAWGMYPS
mmetsp:Transcript_88455/g.245639  ORF Transcript_88455/g.245639 Transcript_88455/m.245639 type:complete len:213 (+) Transcript_88455:2040-2678(+)